ncbi:hypothetical protein DL95DRAFT_525540 [Leptodontidium sp. 2 PMI_412]|nr:hypothetical protein DL95DRAFT_525540 [Leptodontidium sp. 2 PMI_412]
MDTIALATAISTLTGVCLKAAGSFNALQPKFTNQERTIKSLYSECTAISASLTQVQSCVLRDCSPLGQVQLHEIFDVIITGCRVLFACLEQDLEGMSTEAPANKSWKPWSSNKRVEAEWDQKKWQGYLADVRMQQGALMLLNELLLIKTSEALHIKRQNNLSTVQQQALATRKLRAANPGIKVPASVFGISSQSKQPTKPVIPTSYDQSFAFDNMLVNSEAYRQSMGISPSAASRSQPSESSPAELSKPMNAKQERDTFKRTNEGDRTTPDDELPEYTPFPDEHAQGQPPAIDEYVPNPRAIFPRYGVPSTTSTVKSIPKDRIPPAYVPGGPASLPIVVSPSALTYTPPHSKDQQLPVNLHNPNNKPIQFRVKTTAPRKFCVRPNRGTIDAGATVQLNFISVSKKNADCKLEGVDIDKFAIESLVIAPGESFDWNRDGERRRAEVQRVKIVAESVWKE